jgi:hypothetical protein
MVDMKVMFLHLYYKSIRPMMSEGSSPTGSSFCPSVFSCNKDKFNDPCIRLFAATSWGPLI